VHFPLGFKGAHALTNDTDEPARYLMVSTLVSPNVTEYPDTRQLAVSARTKDQSGQELYNIWTRGEPESLAVPTAGRTSCRPSVSSRALVCAPSDEVGAPGTEPGTSRV
jgi:hypothetical protein